MKKLSLVILIMMLVLVGCNKSKVDEHEIDNQYKETRVFEVGEIINLNVNQYLKTYDFNRVNFISSNQTVARINYKEELVIMKAGRTDIEIELYDDNNLVSVINYGEVIVLDINDPLFKPINNLNDLQSIKKSGYYYLNSNIQVIKPMKPISSFEGVLINPHNYSISNLSIDASQDFALFSLVKDAYINGMIFENVVLTGINGSTATLANIVQESYITNVKAQGEISGGQKVAGLFGSVLASQVINCSFEGTISNGQYMGGIASFSENTEIINSYYIGNIGDSVGENTSNIGGIVGMIKGGLIKNTYYAGQLIYTDIDNVSPIANAIKEYYYLSNVIYTIDMEDKYLYNPLYCLNPEVHYYQESDLKQGIKIGGFDAFTFIKDHYPKSN
jgi:hypothetical protein